MHCSEEYATALALAILCRQIGRGLVTDRVASAPHQVTVIDDFVEQLRGADVNFTDKTEAIEDNTQE